MIVIRDSYSRFENQELSVGSVQAIDTVLNIIIDGADYESIIVNKYFMLCMI